MRVGAQLLKKVQKGTTYNHLVYNIFLSKLGPSLRVDCQCARVASHNFYPATTFVSTHYVNHQLKF